MRMMGFMICIEHVTGIFPERALAVEVLSMDLFLCAAGIHTRTPESLVIECHDLFRMRPESLV